jgi:hypothetical protein
VVAQEFSVYIARPSRVNKARMFSATRSMATRSKSRVPCNKNNVYRIKMKRCRLYGTFVFLTCTVYVVLLCVEMKSRS